MSISREFNMCSYDSHFWRTYEHPVTSYGRGAGMENLSIFCRTRIRFWGLCYTHSYSYYICICSYINTYIYMNFCIHIGVYLFVKYIYILYCIYEYMKYTYLSVYVYGCFCMYKHMYRYVLMNDTQMGVHMHSYIIFIWIHPNNVRVLHLIYQFDNNMYL
jgi:hypothetical protein